ncbi:G patch domain-containing protein 11-like [Artemia franciscana]|uniref:G patch domain-containing protein 11 n=1 Tax=Artemia franciscana TaxID=6661 RepID=A0AA88IMX4_ARTSF|nr:hypothetical protein QYM36_002062 [Artemia franciscana]KAK2723587.1 hypothetical protein QYM36_002062 [Artemia franciscana]KAK2723588.1 hypothetical protein QYM36_002062 [Artemia franciscana]
MPSEEELDYMSDDLLKQCEESKALRPGLITDQSRRRKVALEMKHKEMIKNQRETFSKKAKIELERTARTTALETAISSESKGFAMLQKMGYKPGAGLGKSGEGRVEPIPIEIKAGRSGLGRDEVVRRVKEQKEAIKKARCEVKADTQISIEEFRAQQREKMNIKLDASDLAKSQAACEKLDTEHYVTYPAEKWFWRSTSCVDIDDDYIEDEQFLPLRQRKRKFLQSDEEFEEDELEYTEEIQRVELSVSEKLELLRQYLRLVYSYCVWCGVKYQDLNELQSCCPGSKREDH